MNRFFYTIVGLICLAAVGTPACTVAEGETCQIDSDCEPGTLCSLDGQCQTYDEVAASLEAIGAPADISVASNDTATAPDTSEPEDTVPTDQDTSCTQAYSAMFTEAAAQPCLEPTSKRTVTLLQIAEEGHGAVNAAGVGNGIIESGFEAGQVPLSMWIDGTLEDNCEWGIAWIRDEADRLDDCTATFTDTMPFAIPGILEAVIYEAKFAPETNRVTGLINKAEVLANLDVAFREVATKLFVNDVDTDGDGVPDHTSVILELTFED